ncbi:protein-tyrosine phosphatase-like protein [Lipomyces japonicus]|uniref:protein-tyrosine phosphatase-like protein n=1 Tax=Lipomyces japonicus TaxID=56871 RepID=UPI0034CFA2AD
MAMHKIPGHDIYIGSQFALYGQQFLAQSNVTHVLSILRGDIDDKHTANFKHKQIHVDDEHDEDILQYFSEAIEFIEEAVSNGGSVLVHCVAGISRSATVVIAYVMWKHKVSFEDALATVKSGREIANPNDSFVEQLQIFQADGFQVDKTNPAYHRWLLKKEAEQSSFSGVAPAPKSYSDVKPTQSSKSEIRCKKCRCPLAQSSAIIVHDPPGFQTNTKIGPGMKSVLSPSCMHYFLDPVRWMQPELEQGLLEGKFECPKCKTKVGSYRWQGMKCSCGEWVTPGITVQRGRVDEIWNAI